MKAPESLETLVEYGIVQEVVRPLMSGKEAQIYVVVSGGETCVAKVYKEATHRNFKHRSDYTEGRRTRNTRDQRAMAKRTTHGKKKDEDAWRSTEVDMLYRLRDAGVRVPDAEHLGVHHSIVQEVMTRLQHGPLRGATMHFAQTWHLRRVTAEATPSSCGRPRRAGRT